jgi:SAM-dependent methyltransferase
MKRLLNIAKWGITLGAEPQTFLGAKWIRTVLDRVPKSKKRLCALRLLSLSPHYFLRPEGPEFQGLSDEQHLEKGYEESLESRIRIYDLILKGRVQPDNVLIDYGCGPGFLSAAVSPHVKKIYACDISTGALACAGVINAADNVEYLLATAEGLSRIEDGSVDVVISFAMVQHLSDEIFEVVLENCRRKLKQGGKILFHIQMTNDLWKTEDEWRNDTSIKGRLKLRYGLYCFGRSEESHRELVAKHGFGNIVVEDLAKMVPDNLDAVRSQGLLTATKL